MNLKTRSAALIACAPALALVACGGGGGAPYANAPTTTAKPTQPHSASSQRGFLAIASNGALFIQWTRIADTLRGTLTEAYTSLSDPTRAQSESHSFTGVVNGSSVTLTLDSAVNWNGTLNGSGVTLSYANSDGSLRTFEFHSASVGDYNAAVARVQGTAGQAQSERAKAQALAEARQNLDSQAATVQSDIESLNQAVASAESDLSSIADDVKKAKDDLATTLVDKQKVVAQGAKYPDGNYGQVCADAEGVSYDAQSVSYDENGVSGYDADGITGDLKEVADASATLRADFERFAAAQATLPSYRAARAPSHDIVGSALAPAGGASRRIRAAMASYVAQVKQLLRTANVYSAEAQAVCKKVGG